MTCRRMGAVVTSVGALLLLSSAAHAQLAEIAAGTPDFPGSRPLDVPALEPEAASGDEPLEVVVPDAADEGSGGPTPRLVVRRVEIVGNSVLPDTTLSEAAQPYVDRSLDSMEIESLRRALTQLYVDAGYVSSGVVLPDQDLEGGVLRLRVVEGRLTRVEIRGNEQFRERYLAARVEGGADEVLNVYDVERRLQLLRRDPRIRAVRAQLRPGVVRGEATLVVAVVENRRYGARLDVNNFLSPSIGSENGYVSGTYSNAFGLGDQGWAAVGVSAGLVDVDVRYRVPLNRWETRLDAGFRYSDSKIVEKGFDGIDIESDYMAAFVGVTQPVYRSPSLAIELGLTGEWRQSRSRIDGFGFSFTDPTGGNRTVATVLRFHQELLQQGRSQVFALRSTFSFGLDALGATPGVAAPVDFASWLGQAQVVRRFEPSGLELLARGNVQLAFDPLLPFERFAVGGRYSVRGFRQNEFVRDNGYALGFEARQPIVRAPDGRPIVQVVPFFDIGHSWNRGRGGTAEPRTIAGAGLGAVWRPLDWLSAELFWGGQVWAVPDRDANTAQEHGLYFRLLATSF